MKKIGFIGVGIMGKSMVRNLMRPALMWRFIPGQNRRLRM